MTTYDFIFHNVTSTTPLKRTDLVIMPSTLSTIDGAVVGNCPGSSPLFMGTNVGPL